METNKIISIIVFIFFIAFAIFVAIMIEKNLKPGKTEVNCYDRYGNEIIGERCIQEISQSEVTIGRMLWPGLIVFIGVMFAFIIWNFGGSSY